MRKYLNVIKMVLLNKLQYFYNQLFSMIMYAVFIFLFLQLWRYMYGDTNMLAGYTLSQMVWYVAITEIIWGGIRPKKIRMDLSNEIRSGQIAYMLNKPFNYVTYMMSKNIGEVIFGLSMYTVVGIAISLIIIGPLSTFSLISIPFLIITTVLAALISGFIYILISLSAFWIEENAPMFWIYEKLVLAIGVLFPIEIFPVMIQPFIKFSPVYVTTYAPAKMFVDFSFDKFFEVLVFQIGYLVITGLLCSLVYKRGVKKLNVNGG